MLELAKLLVLSLNSKAAGSYSRRLWLEEAAGTADVGVPVVLLPPLVVTFCAIALGSGIIM